MGRVMYTLMNFRFDFFELSRTEQKIFLFIEKNLHRIEDISIKEIEREIFVSKTTVISFTKKLGFNGFKEMKSYILEHRSSNGLKNSLVQEIKENFIDEINYQKIIDLSQEIIVYKKVLIITNNTHLLIVKNFSNYLVANGINPIVITPENFIYHSLYDFNSILVIDEYFDETEYSFIFNSYHFLEKSDLKISLIFSEIKKDISEEINVRKIIYKSEFDNKLKYNNTNLQLHYILDCILFEVLKD